MNAFYKIMALGLLSAVSMTAQSQTFVEGTHYSRVAQSGSPNRKVAEPEVVEYFSFSCPGCYAIEPSIKALVKIEPTLRLRTVHMPFGGRKAKLSQKAFVLMTLLNAKQHKATIFSRIHEQRNTFDSEGELIDFFQTLGYPRSKVAATLNSFSADTMARKMNREAIQNQIRSVPTIIINNTYQVNVGVVNTGESMAALIRYLSSHP